MIRSIRAVGKAALARGAPRRAGQRAHGVIPACMGWGIAGREVLPTCVSPASTVGCYGGQAHSDMRQGTGEVRHEITDALLPQAERSCTMRQRCTRRNAATGGTRAIAGTAREATPSTGHAVMRRFSQEAPSRLASRRHDARMVRGMGVESRLQPVPRPGGHSPRGRGSERGPTMGRCV
jgi:hypothetical protein